MSDNQWPFGDRADPDRSDPAEQGGEPEADDTRAEEQGWGWEDDEPAQEAPAQPAQRPTRRARFRRWRHSRPFWGALFILLGGLLIALIPLGAYKIILVAPSVAIASGVGFVIVILGIVTFMTPSQNKLYGLLSVLMGVIAFVASNLGGFLIGSILTIIGGALTFAWTALPPEQQPERVEEVRQSPEQDTAELGDYAESGEEFDARPEDDDTRWDEGPVEEERPRDEGIAERSWIETR